MQKKKTNEKSDINGNRQCTIAPLAGTAAKQKIYQLQ